MSRSDGQEVRVREAGGGPEALAPRPPAREITESLRLALQVCLPDGNPPLGILALAAGINARTLQRRLRSTVTSYRR
jgi:hypothetical protein